MKKLHKIVMLATNEAETGNIYLTSSKTLAKCDYGTLHLAYNNIKHLYILSNDKIEEGDWFYKSDAKPKIFKWISTTNTWYKDAKKIIATTDSILTKQDDEYSKTKNLPQIPQQFIDYYITEYNKGNIITEVEVEYQEKADLSMSKSFTMINYLKINKDNTINISIPSNKMYSREEVISLLHKFMQSQKPNWHHYSTVKWYEEFLK